MTGSPITFDPSIARTMLTYGRRITARGYVSNTLGNIALRVPAEGYEHGVVYTKHQGVSVEEMRASHIVITDITEGKLLYGAFHTSIGHQLNRAILRHRPDINCVMHFHINPVLSYFTVTGKKEMPFISDDAPLILGKPVIALDPHVNVEADVALVPEFIHDTNAFVMPNHGVTTLGRNLSEAYHRLTTVAAEVERLIIAMQVGQLTGSPVPIIRPEEVQGMYEIADKLIYNNQPPHLFNAVLGSKKRGW